jgi:hypothetical protein
LLTLFLGWPSTVIFLSLLPRELGLKGMYHHAFWDCHLNKWLSLEYVSWGIGLLYNNGFISYWTL